MVCGVFCMFLILKLNPAAAKKRGFRLFSKQQPPSVTRVAVRGGAFFYFAVAALDRHGQTDLTPLLRLGGCIRRIVPAGPLPPLAAPFARFVPKLAPARLFLQTALHVLQVQNAALPSLGISDPNGLLAEAVLPFAAYAGELRVFTNAPQRYAAVGEQIFCKWGLPLVLADRASALSACAVRLFPFTENKTAAPGVWEADGARRTPSGLCLPDELERRRPAGTDALLYLSALYEVCGVPLPGDLHYRSLG